MAKDKKEEVGNVIMIPESTVEMLMEFIKQAAENSDERFEKRQDTEMTKKLDVYKEERAVTKKEYQRVSEILEKEDPGTDRYRELVKDLNDLSRVLGNFHSPY